MPQTASLADVVSVDASPAVSLGRDRASVLARKQQHDEAEQRLNAIEPPRPDELGPGNFTSSTRASLADVAAVEAPSSTDTRSSFARAVDTLSEPSAPGRWLQEKAGHLADLIDAPSLNRSELVARIHGALAGVVHGAGDVVAGFTSPLGIAAGVSGLGAEKAGAAGLINAARALRAVETATGGAFGARGVEQAVDAPDLAGKAMGVAQAASGALGVRGGVQGLRAGRVAPIEAPRPVAGALPSGPSFVADASGHVAPFGTEIPMEQAPDGSYVRSVPGEYARREVRGLLSAPRGFVADEAGNVVPTEQAGRLPPTESASSSRASLADVSHVEAVPAAVISREFQQVPVSDEPGARRVARLVPSQYSGDPNAVDVTAPNLEPDVVHALHWIKADMEAVPFTRHTFNETTGRGGDLEIVPGSAGAPIYQHIVGDVSTASRGAVLHAIDNLLDGKLTPTGDLALGVARELAAGKPSIVRAMTLPPEAGGEMGATGVRASEAVGVDPLDAFLSDIHGEDARLPGNGTYAGREPGEEGQISPVLLARLGLGGAGATYGAATGTDTEDRLKRAALFGAAGFAAPSLLEAGASVAEAAGARGTRTAGTAATAATEDTTGPGREFTPKPGAMSDRPIAATETMPPEQKFGTAWLRRYAPKLRHPLAQTFAEYDGFESQRRGRQPDARVTDLAQRIAVDLREAKPGSIVNVEESRAMANATATLFDRMKAVRAQTATPEGRNDPALTAQLAKLYQDGAVMLGNVRANASEQGRALRGQQIINAALSSYDERILQEASKRLGPQMKAFAGQLALLPDDPRAFYNLLREHVNAGRGPTDRFFSYLYNNVLSGPSTFLKNVLGTSVNSAFQAGANVVAGALEMRKPAAERSVLLGESSAAVSAMASGLLRGGKAALFVLQHGFDPLAVARGEIPAVFTETPGGAATNWPTRLTRAVHGVLFQEGARAFESTSAAYTRAAKEAAGQRLTGQPLKDFLARRTAQLAMSPDIQQQADRYALRATFQEQPGPTLRAFGTLVNSNRALKFLQMFWKTAGNIAVQQVRDNTPLAFVRQFGDSGVYAGGREGAQAQARALLGTALLAPLVGAIGSGMVTGEGPTDPKHRPLWLATHQPNSIRLGDHWIDYRHLPIAMPLSILANLHEAVQEGQASDADTSRVFSMVASRVGNVLTSQPFLAGVTAFVNAMEKPAEQGSRLLKSSAQMLVPFSGLLRNITRAIDPTYREVHSPLDAVKEVTPGASSTLPPRLDLFGEPLKRPGGPIARALAPSLPVSTSTDPLVTYLDSIRAPIGADGRQSVLQLAPGITVKVPPAIDLARRQAAGQAIRPMLEQLVSNPRFQALSDDEKRYLTSQLVATMRGGVRARANEAVKAQAVTNPEALRRRAR